MEFLGPFTATATRSLNLPATATATRQARLSSVERWRSLGASKSSPDHSRPSESGTRCGHFQDRLVTELRLAGTATITEANEILNDFLPRFNEKFGLKVEQDCPAYRSLEQLVPLDGILCFKHRRKVSRDNTVKYNRRTLHLLPDGIRRTYAGAQIDIQEDLDGRLLVQHQGQTVPAQEEPPRLGLLRESTAASTESPRCPAASTALETDTTPTWRHWKQARRTAN